MLSFVGGSSFVAKVGQSCNAVHIKMQQRHEGIILCGDFEQVFNESDLPSYVLFSDLFNLSFPNHVHCFISPQRPPSRLE